MVRVVVGSILTLAAGVPFTYVLITVARASMLPLSENPEGMAEALGVMTDLVLLLPLVGGIVVLMIGLHQVRRKRSQRIGAGFDQS